MSNTKETLWQKTGIERDSVARRVLNTSDTLANISASELEKGVSLETLLSLNVPVYRYKTQITIHGKLPDITGKEYRFIVQNGNGSIGVRYVGIDYEKKTFLCNVARLFKEKFRACMDSQGLTVIGDYPSAEELKSAYESVDTSLFYGTVHAFRYADMYTMSWRYRLEIDVDAIPQESLWNVASNLFACPSRQAYTERVEEEERENQKRHEEYQEANRLREEKEKQQKEIIREKCTLYASTLKKKRLSKVPSKSGESFLYVYLRKDGECALMRVFLRTVFGKLCYFASPVISLPSAPKGSKFVQADLKLPYWQQKCTDGLLFAP